MLEPLAVDPNRSLAPAANSIASARLVFPAPAGPTSAITRVPLDGCPAMRLSLRAVTGARVALWKALGRHLETFTVRLFSAVCKGGRFGSGAFHRGTGPRRPRFFAPMIDPKGHQADSPAEMPKRAWKDILARTYKRTWDDNVALVSAGVAFYGFFALLSLLGLIVLFYGFVADPRTVIEQMRTLTSILPADVVALIGNQLLTAIHSSQQTKGFGILLAVVVAIYGGTNGSASILTALNIAYEEKEKRSLLRFYLLAITMTLVALLVALVAIAATSALAYL